MKGKVYLINHNKGWIAILTENDQFSIVEVLEMFLPDIGDIISGNLESLGGETLFNVTQKENMDVYIQDIFADKKSASRQLQEL